MGALGWIARRHGSVADAPRATCGGPIVRDRHPGRNGGRTRSDRDVPGACRACPPAQLTGRASGFPRGSSPEGSAHVLRLENIYRRCGPRLPPPPTGQERTKIRSRGRIGGRSCSVPSRSPRRRGPARRKRGAVHDGVSPISSRPVSRAITWWSTRGHGREPPSLPQEWRQLAPSREASWPLRPNNFLVASLLETLCQAGYNEYNFGASPSDASGLIRFKEGWGARPRPVWSLARRSALHRRLRP